MTAAAAGAATGGRDRLALAAAAATGVQVGAAIVATRAVVHDLGPASLALLRYAIAVLCLLPFLRPASVRLPVRDLIAIALLGIVQFGVLIALLNLGLARMPSTRASLLFATFPLLTMALAAALGRERLRGRTAAGIALSIAGVGATLGEGLLVAAGPEEWLGAVCVLAAAACGASCAVLYRPYLARHPTLPVGVLAMGASVLVLAVAAAAEGLFTRPPALSAAGWWTVVFIGLSSGIGYLLWLWALKHTAPTRATAFLTLSPITAALLGAGLLGEPVTPGLLVGVAGVGGGLWLATGGPAHGRVLPACPGQPGCGRIAHAQAGAGTATEGAERCSSP